MTTGMEQAACRLAVYGTLAPGKPNAHELAALTGTWTPGTVRGRLVEQGWGAAMGFPAIVLDDAASTVTVQLFQSPDLPAHWSRLDAFEGDGYNRVPVRVSTAAGEAWASIYVSVYA